jgi:glycerophosphoryl diester phosphodiesterase
LSRTKQTAARFALIALAILVGRTCAAQKARAKLPAPRWPIAVVAHRAGGGIAPENTLAAIRQAIRLGVDYVEIDVRTTKDGRLVIMHDGSVDRTTNGHGAVRSLTLAEIRALTPNNRFGARFDGEKVPTLDEVLTLAKGRVNIYLDHKDADTPAVLAALRRRGMERNVLVYNEPEGANAWKRVAPAIPVMPSLPDDYRRPGGVAEFEKLCPAEALDGHFREWTRALVEQAHAAGVKVYVDIMGPDDNPDGYARALAMGVDGIQTDYPDRLTRFLRNQATSKRVNE